MAGVFQGKLVEGRGGGKVLDMQLLYFNEYFILYMEAYVSSWKDSLQWEEMAAIMNCFRGKNKMG